jgi:hypothetical protein
MSSEQYAIYGMNCHCVNVCDVSLTHKRVAAFSQREDLGGWCDGRDCDEWPAYVLCRPLLTVNTSSAYKGGLAFERYHVAVFGTTARWVPESVTNWNDYVFEQLSSRASC